MNPFLRRAAKRTPLRAEAPSPRSDGSGAVTLRLYDPIDSYGGPWGVSAKEFVGVLDELPADTSEIQLLINSPGGEVWQGLAILNALRAHPAKVVAVVEGVAASAASFIAAGVDELHVMKNAELFVHRAWGLALGNAEDMQKLAADLAHEDANLASIYADKSGGTVDDWLAVMSSDKTYSAQEAVAVGLADRVIEPRGDGAKGAKAHFDLSIFNRSSPAASAVGPIEKEGEAVAISDDELSTIRQKLGVAENADGAALIGALDEALTERAEPAAALPEGVSAIDTAQLEELRAAASLGREAHARQARDDRQALVAAAVADGRIAPARRDAWLAQLEADPGAADTLASLEKGLIPVGSPIGHSGEGDSVADDLYASVFGKES